MTKQRRSQRSWDGAGRVGAPGGRRSRAALFVLLGITLFAAGLAFARGGAPPSAPVALVAGPPAAVEPALQGGGFAHGTPAHAGIACASCHERAGNSLRLPGHKACIDCHAPQFISPQLALCSTCHTNLESPNPPVKAFPALRSFNARFDHAQHNTGGARPEAGCATCHRPLSRRSGALSIPARLDAHSTCFQCHSPGAQSGGRDISSCGVCHTLGPYSRTPVARRAFRMSFTHATHGPRQGMNCAACHSVRPGAGQGRQVSSPVASQHFASARGQSCATCHNNRRAFGGDDFGDCKRCHKGQTFRF